MGDWMPFFAGGVVMDEVTASHWGVSPASPTPMTWTQQGPRVGWTVGVGVEKHLGPAWNVRAEYMRDYLAKQTYQWVSNVLYSYTSINTDVIRVGLTRRF